MQPGDLLEHPDEVLLREGAALHVLLGPDGLSQGVTVDRGRELFVVIRSLWRFVHACFRDLWTGDRGGVFAVGLLGVPDVDFGADEEDGGFGEVFPHFGGPHLADVVVGGRGVDGEADHDDVGLVVGKDG